MNKLYDFSAGFAAAAVFAFGLLLSFFAYHYFYGSGLIYGILFLLTAAAFIWLLVHFVFRAASLSEDGVRCRSLFIERARLTVFPEYDTRFNESVYRLRDAGAGKPPAFGKADKRTQITVEATPSNRKKLEAYTGKELKPAEKPKRKKKGGFFR